MQAELGLAAGAADDAKARWRAVQQSLEGQAAALEREPHLRPYVFLITGLLSFVNSDTLVDQRTIDKVTLARRELLMPQRAQIVEQAIVHLNWRKGVIDEFWARMRRCDLKGAQTLFQTELLPTFGQRLPATIQMAVIIADWDSRQFETAALLQRLTGLERDCTPSARDLSAAIRSYLCDGDQARRLVSLMQEKHFDELLEETPRMEWTGLQPGNTPVPVALSQLFARVKTLQLDEAQNMGKALLNMAILPDWVHDIAALLHGYALFRSEAFEDAAESFQRIQSSTLLTHNTDRYWAAAKFSEGLCKLGVGQEAQAFTSFAQSLKHRTGVEETVGLAPLFIHFGLQGIDTRNGNRAKYSFALLIKNLEQLPPSSEVFTDILLAEMGHLLCRSLVDEDISELRGQCFLDLLQEMQITPTAEGVPQEMQLGYERTLRILAICQELRCQLRTAPKQRDKSKVLYRFLQEQIGELERLQSGAGDDRLDPTLMAFKGVVDLAFGKWGRKTDALLSIENAIRLGVQSPNLAKLLAEQKKKLLDAKEKSDAVLNLFDVFLTSGHVPSEVRDVLIRKDEVAELYRMSRNYMPRDIVANNGTPPVRDFCKRIDKLLEFINGEEGLSGDGELGKLRDQLKQLIDTLSKAEKELLEKERNIMEILGRKMREASLEEAPGS
jgi:hypothetical protein